jgi:choline-glycine betaine transporter
VAQSPGLGWRDHSEQHGDFVGIVTFTIVLLIMCYSLYRGLQEEHYHATIIEKMQPETQKIEIPVSDEGSGVKDGSPVKPR